MNPEQFKDARNLVLVVRATKPVQVNFAPKVLAIPSPAVFATPPIP
jgi:hypothetical protein